MESRHKEIEDPMHDEDAIYIQSPWGEVVESSEYRYMMKGSSPQGAGGFSEKAEKAGRSGRPV